MFAFLGLAYFAQHDVLKVQTRWSRCHLPLYGWATFRMSVLLSSSVHGHLGYFRIVAVVSNSAVSVGEQDLLGDPAFSSLGQTPRSRIAAPYGNSIFNFCRNTHTHSPVTAPFSIPTNDVQAHRCVCFWFWRAPNPIVVGLICTSLFVTLSVPHGLGGHWCTFSGEMSVQELCPFRNKVLFCS